MWGGGMIFYYGFYGLIWIDSGRFVVVFLDWIFFLILSFNNEFIES
jgi:hypothetical protein